MPMPRVIENSEWRWVFITGTILLIMLLVPFVWGYGVSLPNYYFMGVLVNPIDGASYQAKMQQGLAGSWMFHLPYTPEHHEGVFLFTFYLGLGHLARLFNLPPIMVFHTARLLGGMLMFLAFYRFVADWTDDVGQRRITWLLGTLGAGFGWLALIFGHLAQDLLILPEAFPLQATFANPHFPWALACALVVAHILLTNCLTEEEKYPEADVEGAALAAATLILVSASPFVLVPLGIGCAALFIWLWWYNGAFPRRPLAWMSVVLIFGLPLAAYNAWAISPANPVFNAWMQQNITPSPPVWDYLIAFGPLLVLAAVGVWASRRLLQPGDIFLLGWLASALLLLYAPLGLQRRFAMGLLFPLAIYAGRGLWRVLLPRLGERWRLLGIALAFAAFLPTTVMAIVSPMLGSLQLAEQGGGLYFVSREELSALNYLGIRAPGRLVLASPEMSLFLPAHGLRVVYGHPYETLHPEARREAVLDFYSGDDCSVIAEENVDYVWVGPRERQLAANEMCPVGDEPIFVSPGGEVAIYAAPEG